MRTNGKCLHLLYCNPTSWSFGPGPIGPLGFWDRSVNYDIGFVAVIVRSDTNTNIRGRTSFVLIGCERSGDVAPCGACRPWIFFTNGVFCFLMMNGSRMEKEER